MPARVEAEEEEEEEKEEEEGRRRSRRRRRRGISRYTREGDATELGAERNNKTCS